MYMTFQSNYADVKKIEDTVNTIMAEEFVESPEISVIETSMGHQKINSVKINIDNIGTLSNSVIERIARGIGHTVDHMNIEEYHNIEQVVVELFFKT